MSSQAWYLLNTEKPAYERHLVPCHDWYRCQVWASIGQRPSITEWEVQASESIKRALQQAPRSADGDRRAGVYLRHVNPRGPLAIGDIPKAKL